MLSEEDIVPTVVKDMLFLLKKKGNAAVHDSKGSLKDAKEALESVFLIGKWYYTFVLYLIMQPVKELFKGKGDWYYRQHT